MLLEIMLIVIVVTVLTVVTVCIAVLRILDLWTVLYFGECHVAVLRVIKPLDGFIFWRLPCCSVESFKTFGRFCILKSAMLQC